ncbi:DUF1266 domain-containing protein [Paenibacillus sp. FSL W8-0426]|uniref:DUF1266 domain-containing protein n=1 Tax=Paenibacillus sp. FSL W8-0426 TaxID=2921714 RepID=UPI0030D8B3DF
MNGWKRAELSGQVPPSLKLADKGPWLRGMSAVIYELEHLSKRNDYEFEAGEEERERMRETLLEDWEIHDKASMLLWIERVKGGENSRLFEEMRAFLDTMRDEEQLKYIQSLKPENTKYHEYLIVRTYMYQLPAAGIAAWDWAYDAYLCRKCAHVGIITRTESNALLLDIALKAQSAYNSWKEYAVAFMAGRLFRLGTTEETVVQKHLKIVQQLFTDPDSIYIRVKWDLALQ